MPRTELTKKLWNYIKTWPAGPREAHNDRADEKLLPIFEGKKAVTMAEMVKLF
jgi:chromatin remodeling complex protein RSC6